MVTLMATLSFPLDFISADELQPGMKGIGKTVFKNGQITEFDVEIIAVLRNIAPKGDLILARLKNELLDKTGLIAGMSGSPVYIDGKLIGAVAYGWGFTKETIAGITPIAEMLSILDEDVQITAGAYSGKLRYGRQISVGKYMLKDIIVYPSGIPEYDSSSMVLMPIATPLMVGGFTQEIMNEMEPIFKNSGLIPFRSGGGSAKGISDMVPGGVIGAQLLCGDCELTALGTVTYNRKGKVLGFGHPFLGMGKVNFPMTGGTIHTIVPSQMFSFKLGSPTSAVGRINLDTRVAIGGEIGKLPQLIPLHISIKTKSDVKRFSYKMIEDEVWTPNLLNWCILNSIIGTPSAGKKSANVKLEVKLEGYSEPTVIENSTILINGWSKLVTEPLAKIMTNQFRQPKIQGMNLEMELSDIPLAATIQRVQIDKSEVKPGEDIHLTVNLKPYESRDRTFKTTIRIPENFPDGEFTVIVCDANSSIQITEAANPCKLRPNSLEGLLSLFQKLEKNNEIIVRIFTPFGGFMVHGRELPALPSSVINIMSSSKETGIGSFSGEICRRIPTDWIVSGHHQLQIKVKGE